MVKRSGIIFIWPLFTASMAGSASGFDLDEPLLAGPGSTTVPQRRQWPTACDVWLDLNQQALLLQVDQQVLAAVEPVQAVIRPGFLVHGGVRLEDVNQRQVVPLGNLEVDRVMGG